MGQGLQSLAIFVLLLVVLNFFLGEMDYGIHISIIGSIVVTLLVSGILGGWRR